MGKTASATQNYLEAKRIVRARLGLHLEIDPFAGEEFAHHRLYLSKPPKLEAGLTYPKEFRYWRHIYREELPEVEVKLQEILTYDDEDVEVIDCLFPIFNIDLPPKQVNRLLKIVKRQLKLDPENEESRGICIIPEEGEPYWEAYATSPDLPKAFLPPVSWFSEALQGLQIEDILTILPPHEQIIYALTMGRALCGADSTIHAKTQRLIRHSWRTAPILTGMPGIGKSTLTKYLIKALKTVGYKIAEFSSLSKQFGISDIVCVDLAYADDLNEDSFKNYINSPLIKQCITGGTIRTEKKFLDEVESAPTAAFLCNINDFNINVTYGTDDGVLDRLKILDCRMPTQFDEIKATLGYVSKKSPNLHPIPHIEYLTNKLKCSQNALMLRFARLCADKFLAEMDANTLNHTVNYSTCELQIQLHKHYDKVIAMVFQLSYILRRKSNYTALLPDLKPALLGACIQSLNYLINDDEGFWVREEIKRDWKSKDRPSYHPWTGVKLLDVISVDNAAKAYQESSVQFADKEIDKCVKTIYGAIRLNQGYNVPANTSQIIRAWEGSQKQFNSLLDIADRVRNKIRKETLEELQSGRVANTQHIRAENFNRQHHADDLRNNNPTNLQSKPYGRNSVRVNYKK